MKILLFLSFFSFNAFSDDDFKIITPKAKREIRQTLTLKSSSVQKGENFKRLEELAHSTNNLLGRFQERTGVWDFGSEYDFKTGTVIKGILLNSVVSTNLESPMLVEVADDSKLPSKTIFSCKGVTKYKRVLTACNKLIIADKDGEFEVEAGLLNLDGSAGLKPDEVYTGKEEYIAATIATAFSKGLIELKTDRLPTPYGELTVNTSKNRLMNGVLGSLDETSNIMKEEMQNKEPKVYVKAGRPVLIYFFSRFKL